MKRFLITLLFFISLSFILLSASLSQARVTFHVNFGFPFFAAYPYSYYYPYYQRVYVAPPPVYRHYYRPAYYGRPSEEVIYAHPNSQYYKTRHAPRHPRRGPVYYP